MKFNETDLTQLHEDLQTKKISAKELTKAAFDRIKETDDDVKAFITLNEDEALKRAEAIDNEGIAADKLLAGVPLAVKDNIVTKGLKTTAILDNSDVRSQLTWKKTNLKLTWTIFEPFFWNNSLSNRNSSLCILYNIRIACFQNSVNNSTLVRVCRLIITMLPTGCSKSRQYHAECNQRCQYELLHVFLPCGLIMP